VTELSERAKSVVPSYDLPIERGPDGFLRTVVSFRKPDRQRIRGLILQPRTRSRGLVLIAPGMGRTIRHSTALALPLAHHGFASLRFDLTNHTGDSDGEIAGATLSSAVGDLRCVIEAVRVGGWDGPLFTIASSLSARSAVRAAKEGLPIDGLLLVFPIVDFQKTLRAATGVDLVAAYREGRIGRDDPVRVLTHDMSGRFLADAVAGGYCGLDSTRAEMAQARMPVAAMAAEDDEWVEAADVASALEQDSFRRHLFVLERVDHDSYSWGFMRATSQTAVRALSHMLGDELGSFHDVRFTELVGAFKIEKQVIGRAREVWRAGDG
jgi:Acyl transferase